MKHTKQIFRLYLLLFILVGALSPVCTNANESSKEVLVLNSVNFNLPWAKSFYWHFHDAMQTQGVVVKAESLSIPALQSVAEANLVTARLRQKYPNPPAAIVMIGDPAWIVCRSLFDDVWKDVPVIITNARHYLPATLEALLSRETLNEENAVLAKSWREGYNVTTLEQLYYVKETIDLIYQLMPDMKRLAFISDDRYISGEARRDVKNTVDQYFPELTLELLTTSQLSTEMLLDTLNSYQSNTGLIYYSWFETHNEKDNSYLFDHLQEIITNFSHSPLFLLASEDLSDNMFAGGCYVSAESFGESLLEMVNHILDGVKASDIKGRIGGEKDVFLCYPVLKAYNIPSSRYPKNAVYINEPRSFFEEYQAPIWYSISFVIVLIVTIFYYICILKKANSRLSDAMEKVEQANHLKTAFLANMSHEIRTPLNAIVGFSNMLPEAENPEEMQEYVELISVNTDLLLQLINDILDVSKIEAGTFDFFPSLINVSQTIEEIEQSMQLRIKVNSVTLIIEECLPECMFYTDKNRLIQLITNLVTNAIKFTEKGTIRMGYRMKSEQVIYFYVADTGCGMTKEQCEHVFDRFVKYNSFIQGTGLGLSICRMIVERLGGEIGVHSEEGKGSLFWFTLPYRDTNSGFPE